MDDLISRKALKDAMYHEAFEVDSELQKWDGGCWIRYKMFENVIDDVPSAQPEDWMERNKERILQAGMEGREIEFRIGGRLFAIREKAQ